MLRYSPSSFRFFHSPSQWALHLWQIPPSPGHQPTQTVRVTAVPATTAAAHIRRSTVPTVRGDAAVPVAAVLNQIRIVVTQSIAIQTATAAVHLLHRDWMSRSGHKDIVRGLALLVRRMVVAIPQLPVVVISGCHCHSRTILVIL